MLPRIYEIFKECFPNTSIEYNEFCSKLDLNDSVVLKKYNENMDVVAFSVIRNSCISLICVLPEYQNKGLGTELMEEAENLIEKNGYSEILLGYGGDKTSLFTGVPFNKKNIDFFSKRGYDDDFMTYDYSLDLSTIRINDTSIYELIDLDKQPNVSELLMQYLESKDKQLHDKYYLDDSISIICARKDKSLDGFCFYKIGKHDNHNIMKIFDLVSFPNFDVNSKIFLLYELNKIAKEKNCEEVLACQVSNPAFYTKIPNSAMQCKYWRGSK